MNEPYPVTFDVERPAKFDRAQVFLRIALLVVIGWIAHPIGLLWVGVPIVAAILISQKGGQRYLEEEGSTVSRILGWLLELVAYLTLVADRPPSEGRPSVSFQVERSGSPTLGSALLRIVNVWLIAIVCVLISETYPEGMWRFLLGIVRWEACVLAYLASLVDRYPPFTLQTAPMSSAAST